MGEQTCDQLERVEFLFNLPSFQNGGSVFTETFSSDWRLDDKNRFERCLLYCASKQSTSTPFAFHAWRPEIPIFLPPLRVRTCPSPFYEALEACCCPIKETRSETDHLSRRHYCCQSDSGGHCEGQGLNPLAAPASRLCDQFTSCPVHGIPRFCHQSLEMKLFLPPGKMSQLVQDCKDLISEKSASVRTLSQIIGKLTSTMQAVLPAPLHYRHLQMLQVKGLLEGKEYNSVVPLNMECRNDLQWWIDQLSIWNGRSLISPAPDLIITTDASLKGWGAVCQGVHTRGLWTQEESLLHINALELKAALFALRAFSKSRRKLHVQLRMDNRTAVAYLLKMGGGGEHGLWY